MWDEISMTSSRGSTSPSPSLASQGHTEERPEGGMALIDRCFAFLADADLSAATKSLKEAAPLATAGEISSGTSLQRRSGADNGHIAGFLNTLGTILEDEARYLSMEHVKRAKSRVGKGWRAVLPRVPCWIQRRRSCMLAVMQWFWKR